MADLRALLGGKYDETIGKVTDAIGGDTDYLGCGCCTGYNYDESAARTGEYVLQRMAAHDALAAVLPELLADAWDEGHAGGMHNAHEHREHRKMLNPYRHIVTAAKLLAAVTPDAAPVAADGHADSPADPVVEGRQAVAGPPPLGVPDGLRDQVEGSAGHEDPVGGDREHHRPTPSGPAGRRTVKRLHDRHRSSRSPVRRPMVRLTSLGRAQLSR